MLLLLILGSFCISPSASYRQNNGPYTAQPQRPAAYQQQQQQIPASWGQKFNEPFMQRQLPVASYNNNNNNNINNFNVRSFNQKPYVGNGRSKQRSFNLLPQQPSKKCGVLRPQIRNYVANGEATSHTEWPWYVQVIIKSDVEAYCGGTIIDESFVLTAAHCFDEIPVTSVAAATTVLLKGVRIRNKYNRQYDDIIVQAADIYIHPGYVPAMSVEDAEAKGVEPGPKNDMAIIRINVLDKEILEQIIPACLPAHGYQIPVNAKCKIMGHGFINAQDEDNFIMPHLLQMADVYISKNEVCQSEVDSESIKSKINDDTLCIRGPIHPCVGDSGGPLICKGVTPDQILGELNNAYDYDSYSNDKKSEWYLAGVTSFAVSTDLNDKCGLFKSAVFGKVSNNLKWINSVLYK